MIEPRIASRLAFLGALLLATACRPAASAEKPPTDPLPGAPALDADTSRRLALALSHRDPADLPHTRYLRTDGSPRYANRLLFEASPYLRQHAFNPVNWYAWGDEAFATAKQLNRPVLLSVGYSTCHWCHVMEEESYDDEETARLLNENYVAIKVDREEHPEVDSLYIAVTEALTGGGGWPNNVFLTPERAPFFAGTYFPASSVAGGPPAFKDVLRQLKVVYDREPDHVAANAKAVTEAVRGALALTAGDLPGEEALQAVAPLYAQHFDGVEGGLQRERKFPADLPIGLLLRNWRRTGDTGTLKMATLTLEKMAAGGIHDPIGGGFHRYSTDPHWKVPHFEKMLYDNAQLAVDYLEAWQATGRGDFAAVSKDTLAFLEHDLRLPGGAFASATDADSLDPQGRREEGRFFTWTPAEVEGAVGPAQAPLVEAAFGITAAGDVHGRAVANREEPAAALGRAFRLSPEAVESALAAGRERLLAVRVTRPAPALDDKVVAAWNGLAISAFARAGLAFGDARLTKVAAGDADFVLSHLMVDGRLGRSWRAGTPGPDGTLEDYSFLIAGLLDLFEATGEVRWLDTARNLDGVLAGRYEDPAGGFFRTPADAQGLFAREKPAEDSVEPSGNSVAALNLLRLAELTGDDKYRRRADGVFQALAGRLRQEPVSVSALLVALEFRDGSPLEIAIVAPYDRAEADPFLRVLGSSFVPNRVLALVKEKEVAALAGRLPFVGGKVAKDGKTTAYVCTRGVCKLPVTDIAAFRAQLAR